MLTDECFKRVKSYTLIEDMVEFEGSYVSVLGEREKGRILIKNEFS